MEANRSPELAEERSVPVAFDWLAALEEREAQARELIRAHPVATVLGAAALGFAIARLVRSIR
ncbi:MAG: hypothetical protein ACHQ6V_14150 [Myxococcota bacterium]